MKIDIFTFVLLILGLAGSLTLLIIEIIKRKKSEKEAYIKLKADEEKEINELNKTINEAKNELEKKQEALNDIKKETEFELKARSQKIEETIAALEEKKQLINNSVEETIANKEEIVELTIRRHYESIKNAYETDLHYSKEQLLADARLEFNANIEEMQNALEKVNAELAEAQSKRDAINEQILRQRAIEEQRDFYRICITSDDLADINVLYHIKSNLFKPTFLDKAIYDNYVSKYVKEMSKRVLKGENPTGIYKVTNIQTQEVYIGKSTTIADRWTNHCKSAYGLEGVSDSQFQRALKKYGIQNFTWELLEKTTKEQLTNREKYYIEFYNTTKYGYNQRIG